MVDLYTQIQEAEHAIRAVDQRTVRVGIVLGTGLGALVNELDDVRELPYADIPHVPESTVQSHAGQLVLGTLRGVPVAACEGRFHAYEGYAPQEATFLIRVLKALGAEALVLSNAAGGLNPDFERGDIMAITDHINLMGINPLAGPNDERLGLRFPDMLAPYDPQLLALLREVAAQEGIPLREGVYVGVLGPNLETPAEYRMLKTIGADAVGMSTVPEVIVGVHSQLRIAALSCITDMCLPDALEPVDIDEIIAVANRAEPVLTKLVAGLVERLA